MSRIHSPTFVRANLFRLLDEVLETGVPIEIDRGGRRLRIVPAEPVSRFSRVVGNPDYLAGDPEDIVHMDWTTEWRP